MESAPTPSKSEPTSSKFEPTPSVFDRYAKETVNYIFYLRLHRNKNFADIVPHLEPQEQTISSHNDLFRAFDTLPMSNDGKATYAQKAFYRIFNYFDSNSDAPSAEDVKEAKEYDDRWVEAENVPSFSPIEAEKNMSTHNWKHPLV
ncbi:MAG: hypothetical protein Q9224_007022 [Gallowayella concinna]